VHCETDGLGGGCVQTQVRAARSDPRPDEVGKVRELGADQIFYTNSPPKEINGYPSDFFIVFPPTAEVLSPQSAPHVVQQVTAALRTEQPRVEATRVDIVTPSVGSEVLLLGPTPLILACIAIMIYHAARYGWRVGLSLAVTNIRNMVIILGLFLSTYIIFRWEFSLLPMTAMGALAILATGAGTVYALRADQSDL
jgi:preprotein translocase subunit SecF